MFENLVALFKHHSNGGYIDNILELKSKNCYDYIKECCFLGQISSYKVFLFKMSTNGVNSEMGFIAQMQSKGDLENSWIMFDHVKHVIGQTTMVCHVYDLTYCKIVTIAIFDMQFENIEAQQIMWTKLNHTILKHRNREPNFKGFMADNAQANQNVVRIVYNSRHATVMMVDKECASLFHFTLVA